MRVRARLMTIVGLTAALGLAADAAAQDVRYGVKGGLNVSNLSFSIEDDVTVLPGARGGIAVGGFMERELRQGLSGLIEALVTMKGSSFENVVDDASVRLVYLEVPVLARAALTAQNGTRVHLYAGPAFGLKMSESLSPDPDDDTEPGEDEGGPNNRLFNPLDFSLAFGGSVEIRNALLDIRYTLGLVNVADEDDFPGLTVRNRTFTVSVGWRLR